MHLENDMCCTEEEKIVKNDPRSRVRIVIEYIKFDDVDI